MKTAKVILSFFAALLLSTNPVFGQDQSLKSLISMAGSPNKDHGRLYANSDIQITQGSDDVVYGVRDKGCVPQPPSLGVALSLSGFMQPVRGVAEIYDAGIGFLLGHGCSGEAAARAIGIKIAKDFTGKVEIPYFERKITITVLPSKQDEMKSMVSFSGSPNSQNVGEVPAGGELTLSQGQRGVIYGIRAQGCSATPPSFEDAVRGIKNFPKGLGKIYDAGVGFRLSGSCGKNVGVRAIGIELDKDFTGKVEIPFFGDRVMLTVLPLAKVAGS
jgi:hypothetical protein